MSRIPDRKRLRRKYLADKGGAYLAAVVCTALFLPAMVVTALSGGLAVGLLLTLLMYLSTASNTASMLFVALAGVSAFSGGLAWIFWHGIREASQQAQQLEYVPPVDARQLPLAEVLVRGTEQDRPEEGAVLLRVVGNPQEEAREHLLRAAS